MLVHRASDWPKPKTICLCRSERSWMEGERADAIALCCMLILLSGDQLQQVTPGPDDKSHLMQITDQELYTEYLQDQEISLSWYK